MKVLPGDLIGLLTPVPLYTTIARTALRTVGLGPDPLGWGLVIAIDTDMLFVLTQSNMLGWLPNCYMSVRLNERHDIR